MSTLIQAVIGFLSEGFGKQAGSAIAGASKLAMLAPAVWWLIDHKEQVAVTLTYGHLAIAGLVGYFVLELVHRTPPS